MAYTRINWKNTPSTDTPINAENLKKMDEGIDDIDTRLTTVENDINIITASLTANSLLTIPTGQFAKIPFDVSEIMGTKLTLNNNGVKIGADVKKILINGNVRFGYSEAGTKSSRLLKNGVLVRELSMQLATANTQTFSNLLLSVSENDVFTIEITSNKPEQNIVAVGTWLTVEFIE